jgi:hypothetical protein
MSCKQPKEKVCSLRFPRAENPRKNPWIDHINREARKLAISYMSAIGDARVKASYKKPLRLKKKKISKGPSIDEELQQLEQTEQQETEQQEQFGSPPRSPIPTRKPKTDTTKKTMKALLQMSPVKTPDFSKLKPDTTKRTLKKILETSPIKTPDFSKLKAKRIPKFKATTPPRKNPESIIRNPKTRIISRRIVEK